MKIIPPKSLAAFTLVELLIVLAIVPISTLALVLLVNGIGINRDRLEMRMDADEAARKTLATWRQDVAAATRIASDDEGRTMVITRLNDRDAPTTVTYLLAENRDLVRLIMEAREQESPASFEVLARGVADLHFSPLGSAFRIQWAAESSDGLQTWRSEYNGLATPLFPEAER